VATSGSYNFSINRDELIKDSLIDIGAIASEDSVNPNINAHASRSLNMLIKAYHNIGMQLWKLKRITLFLEKDKHNYNIGPSGDHATEEWDRLTNKTEMRVAAIATDTTMEVDSTTGMTALDNVGIELDDGTSHWTTIASVTDTDTFELTTAIPTSKAVAINNDVYWYTSKAQRPLMIVPDQIWVSVVSDGSTRPIELISREEFWRLSNKYTDGSVSQAHYDPQLTNGVLRVFTEPSSVIEVVEFIAQMPIEDLDTAADEFDLPQSWYLALKFNLSLILAPSYGVRREQFNNIKELATFYLSEAEAFDSEKTSIFIRPEKRGPE